MSDAPSHLQESARHLFGVCPRGCVNAWQNPGASEQDRRRFRAQMMADARAVVEVSEADFEKYRARLGRCSHAAVPVEVVPTGVAEKLATQLRYAVDALEGKPWTGWTTNDAHAALAEYRAVCPREGDR